MVFGVTVHTIQYVYCIVATVAGTISRSSAIGQ